MPNHIILTLIWCSKQFPFPGSPCNTHLEGCNGCPQPSIVLSQSDPWQPVILTLCKLPTRCLMPHFRHRGLQFLVQTSRRFASSSAFLWKASISANAQRAFKRHRALVVGDVSSQARRKAQRGHSGPLPRFLPAISANTHIDANERDRETNDAVRRPSADRIQSLATSAATVSLCDWTVKEAEKPEFTLLGHNNPLFLCFSWYSALFTIATNDADEGINK